MKNTPAVISNNTSFNILVSYAYLNNHKTFTEAIFKLSEQGIANVMIDSGAFTIHKSSKQKGLTLETYCDFLKQYGHFSEKYVMFDVIRDAEKSKENYNYMLEQGLNPMFVFTEQDEDWDFLKKAVDNNPHFCMAGGVTNKGKWMQKRFQDAKLKTKGKGKAHGLGYVSFPYMFQVPVHSVDSSSWLQAPLVYGMMPYFDKKMKTASYKDILRGTIKMPKALALELESLQVTPKEFSKLENHRGNYNLGFLLSGIAFRKYQQYAKRHGVDLFLAAANLTQLKSLEYIRSHTLSGTLTYDRYKIEAPQYEF